MLGLLVLLGLLGLLGGCGSANPHPKSASSSSARASIQGSHVRQQSAKPGPATPVNPSGPATAFANLERRFHARLGVYVLDSGTGRTVDYHAETRFGFASTAKALTAGAILRTNPTGLDRVVTYRASELQNHSPITSRHVATGMTLRELLAASLEYSDNTAANLLLAQLGGPARLQQRLRSLGDTTTHVDRTEPSLNETSPGDLRDTSTPRALGSDLRAYVLGDVLTAAERQILASDLIANRTGGPYIRAGVPAGWKVGDRTGSADHGTRNDIAILWRPDGAPIVVSVLSDRQDADAASDDALIADATAIAIRALAS